MLSDIFTLTKNSEGYINTYNAEELDFFEFLFYCYKYMELAKEKNIIKEKEREEQMDLITEGIKSLISVVGG